MRQPVHRASRFLRWSRKAARRVPHHRGWASAERKCDLSRPAAEGSRSRPLRDGKLVVMLVTASRPNSPVRFLPPNQKEGVAMITFSAARAASLALIGLLIASAPAHAVTLKQLQQQLNAKKVRAGSV